MNIVTANVGQGALAVIRHDGDAIIVDTRVPSSSDDTVVHVKTLLANALKDHCVRGLIFTGFDKDHTEVVGATIVCGNIGQTGLCIQGFIKTAKRQLRFSRLLTSKQSFVLALVSPSNVCQYGWTTSPTVT